MQEYTVSRTGDAPLKFKGEMVASADGKWFNGKDQNRWHEITIFRTAGGKYVLSIEYRTQWQGEADAHDVEVCDDIEKVVDFLRFHDPLEHLAGYPRGVQGFEEKQAALEESLRRRWDALLTEVLGEIPEAAETIE